MFKKAFQIMVLLISTCVLYSCSMTPDLTQEVKQRIQFILDHDFPGVCRVISVKKYDGKVDSQKYIMYYEYHVEILKNAPHDLAFAVYGSSDTRNFRWVKKASNNEEKVNTGDVYMNEGAVEFRKTSQGWLFERYIYKN